MFARVFALLPLALVVSASHIVARDNCSNGQIHCCDLTQQSGTSSGFVPWLNVVDAPTQALALLSNQCSPITVIGAASACQVSQQTICCNNNNQNGLVNVGCAPINIAV